MAVVTYYAGIMLNAFAFPYYAQNYAGIIDSSPVVTIYIVLSYICTKDIHTKFYMHTYLSLKCF